MDFLAARLLEMTSPPDSPERGLPHQNGPSLSPARRAQPGCFRPPAAPTGRTRSSVNRSKRSVRTRRPAGPVGREPVKPVTQRADPVSQDRPAPVCGECGRGVWRGPGPGDDRSRRTHRARTATSSHDSPPFGRYDRTCARGLCLGFRVKDLGLRA